MLVIRSVPWAWTVRSDQWFSHFDHLAVAMAYHD